MPLYRYRCTLCQQTTEQFAPSDKIPKSARCPYCGMGAKRELGFHSARPSCWPMESDACGCHPDQREEFMRTAAAHGIPTEFNHDGCAIFTSREHRKRFCETFGYYDRNAGYGDPTPGGPFRQIQQEIEHG